MSAAAPPRSLEGVIPLDADAFTCDICTERRIEVAPPCQHFVCKDCMANGQARDDAKRRRPVLPPNDAPEQEESPNNVPEPEYECMTCRQPYFKTSVIKLPYILRDLMEASVATEMKRCKSCGWAGQAADADSHECLVTPAEADALTRAAVERCKAEHEQQRAAVEEAAAQRLAEVTAERAAAESRAVAEAAAAERRLAEVVAEREAAERRAAAEAAARQQLEADAAAREHERQQEEAAAAQRAAEATAAMEQRIATAEAEKAAEAERREAAERNAAADRAARAPAAAKAKAKAKPVPPPAPTFTALPQGPPKLPPGYTPPPDGTVEYVRQCLGNALSVCSSYVGAAAMSAKARLGSGGDTAAS